MLFGPTWKLGERGQSAPAFEERVVDLVVATKNRKKADEIRRILQGSLISILTLDDFPGCPEVIEDGQTFEANAVKKAVAVARYTGQAVRAGWGAAGEVRLLHRACLSRWRGQNLCRHRRGNIGEGAQSGEGFPHGRT